MCDDKENLRCEGLRLAVESAKAEKELQEVRSRYDNAIAELRANKSNEEGVARLKLSDIDLQISQWRLRAAEAGLG